MHQSRPDGFCLSGRGVWRLPGKLSDGSGLAWAQLSSGVVLAILPYTDATEDIVMDTLHDLVERAEPMSVLKAV